MKFSASIMLAMLLAPGSPSAAQDGANGLVPGRRHLSGYVAGSWSDRFGPAYASIPTQPYAMLIGRAEYVLEASGPFALAFYMELMPAIVVDGVPRYHWATLWKPPEGPMVREKVWDEPAMVFGAGVIPAGLQLYANVSPTVSVFGSISAGAAVFTRDMPVPDARRLNFLADAGTGVRLARSGGSAILVGFKFHHMSNANLGRQNPGIDGNVLYAGLSKAR